MPRPNRVINNAGHAWIEFDSREHFMNKEWDPFELVHTGLPMTFRWGDEEMKAELLRENEKIWGQPMSLGNATTCKLEFLLESMQLYSGDPSNCLQYKGKWFVAYDINDLEMALWDQIRGTDSIVPIADTADGDSEIVLWYANQCTYELQV